MTSYAASASVLLWMVDADQTSAAGIDSWDYAKVSYASSDNHEAASSYLNIGDQGASSSTWGQQMSKSQVETAVEWDGYALGNLASLGSDATSQYYFIELYDSSNNLLGYSSGLGGSDLNNYIKEWSAISDMTQSMTGWGGGSFTAVPEPTSGLLMLLGMAVLGLRRKKAV